MTTEPTDERLAAAFAEVKAALTSGEAARRDTPPPWFLITVTTVKGQFDFTSGRTVDLPDGGQFMSLSAVS